MVLSGIVLTSLALLGVTWHVQASLVKGKWVGTIHEVKFVGGTLLALGCFPAAIAAFSA